MADRNDKTSAHSLGAEQIDAIVEALSHLRFGVIQLTVHDGRLMQLDVTERRRFA
ncbi:YezD family protein [Croceicoccus sp. BE223]|uniref:YezD family protein n=1 Tax=Croceicoccus sp. BE223 TaxID=2817716 RepID=UPI00285C5E7D|nr:YezD family protein [Croceicoccus sp. BE223]MDR7102896.1 hypothetical protein [Croceicoccus sp. BE223]